MTRPSQRLEPAPLLLPALPFFLLGWRRQGPWAEWGSVLAGDPGPGWPHLGGSRRMAEP